MDRAPERSNGQGAGSVVLPKRGIDPQPGTSDGR